MPSHARRNARLPNVISVPQEYRAIGIRSVECVGPLIDCVEDLGQNPVRPTRKTALATSRLSLARLESMEPRNIHANRYGQEPQGCRAKYPWAHRICQQNAIANQVRRSLNGAHPPRINRHRRRRSRRVECDPRNGHHPQILHQKKPGRDGRVLHDANAYSRSNTAAIPCPPPIHMVTRAYLPLTRCSSYSALVAMKAPEQPIG